MAHLFCKYQKRVTAQHSCCELGGELEEKLPWPFCKSHSQRSCGKINGRRRVGPVDHPVTVLLQRIKKQRAGEVMKVAGRSAYRLRNLPQNGLRRKIEGNMEHLQAAACT